jgi:CRISPR-associated protein Csx3
MYSFNLKMDGEILRVGFNRALPADGDRIVKDAMEVLQQAIDRGEITGGKLILIDGAHSLAVAYCLSHKLGHLYQAVAVLDPKLGSKVVTMNGSLRYKSYIVTISHGQEYQVGDIIETQEQESIHNIIKVVLCGPPHSGKSCLREGLKQALFAMLDAPYPYVITACPDGEGSWFQETYQKNKFLAEENKKILKSELNANFARKASQWVKSANRPLNIIDVGGMISPENETIMKEASHAVIIAGNPDKFSEWENFCRKLDLKIVAKIHSDLDGTEDRVILPEDWKLNVDRLLETGSILNGSIHRLSRGENLAERETIVTLAQVLNYLTIC